MEATKKIEIFSSYMRNIKNYSDKTVSAYSSDLSEYFRIMGDGDFDWCDVESKYINHLVENGNSPASRARKLSALRSYYKWAVKSHLEEDNPIEAIESPKIPTREPKVMSDNEVAEVLKCAMSDRNHVSKDERYRNYSMLVLMFSTGVRRSEVIEIKLSDIDLSENSITIHGKGNKERIVYFNDEAKETIIEYINNHRPNLENSKDSDYLFVSRRSGKMCAANVNLIVNKYYNQAGVKDKGYTVHSTRKAFATRVYMNTSDLVATQKLLGHEKPETTMRYVRASEQLKKSAAMSVRF